ncbi:G-protein coupled receptor 4-like [Dicentrarchus labrax]|uniref:G-protein coupled receptors family 1 profile domain-containing protein n=1 Tax=Dicentrarchus labrax TaxID=13489 RepID=A0A8C4DY91_DICLA|nr:G-protein coupled receptor 4-like [Dicentrarchus labrax]
MEDFYSNNSSQYINYGDRNVTFDFYEKFEFIMNVVTRIIICIGLPLILVAIYAVYSEVRSDHVAPIYVINLLISDLIQLCSFIFAEAQPREWKAVFIHNYGVAASVCFMVCIALERYLVIAFPLWYRFRRTIKTSVVVCIAIWTAPLVFLLTFSFWVGDKVLKTVFGIFLLLPLPLLIFFLGGTLKALSSSRVPSDEKRRIVGVLVLVLLIYTLLFLPRIIWFLVDKYYTFDRLSYMLVQLSPLADLVLYVFMRKGTIDKLLASVCCCRMDSNDISSSSV